MHWDSAACMHLRSGFISGLTSEGGPRKRAIHLPAYPVNPIPVHAMQPCWVLPIAVHMPMGV